jgi:hypothetical protein
MQMLVENNLKGANTNLTCHYGYSTGYSYLHCNGRLVSSSLPM